jgi:hypothetical protein
MSDLKHIWQGLESNQRKELWKQSALQILKNNIECTQLPWKTSKPSLPAHISLTLKNELEFETQSCYFSNVFNVPDCIASSLLTNSSPKSLATSNTTTTTTQKSHPNKISKPSITLEEIDALRAILGWEATYFKRHHLIDGYTRLTAQLYLLLDRDITSTFVILCAISTLLIPYHVDPPIYTVFRIDACLLSTYLAMEIPEVCTKFTESDIDIIDLSDILCQWAPSVYAIDFSNEIIGRIIDILLCDSEFGVYILFALFYGIIRSHKHALIQSTSPSLFTTLTDLPSILSKVHIADSFAYAYKTIRLHFDEMKRIRALKDWQVVLDQTSPIPFSTTIGERSVSTFKQYPSKKLSTTNTNDPATQQNLSDPTKMSFSLREFIADTSAEKQTSETSPLKKLSTIASSSNSTENTVKPSTTCWDELKNIESIADINHLKSVIYQIFPHLLNSTTPSLSSPPASNGFNQSSPSITLPTTSVDASSSLKVHEEKTVPTALTSTASSTAAATVSVLESVLQSMTARHPPSAFIKFSEINDYQSFPCVYMEGYLLKSRQAVKFFAKGKKPLIGTSLNLSGNLFGAALHRRFFVLQGHFLTYFKSHAYKKPTRDEAMDLRRCWIEELEDQDFVQFGFGFEIRMRTTTGLRVNTNSSSSNVGSSSNNAPANTTEPLFVLFASDEKQRRAWINVLRLATQQP